MIEQFQINSPQSDTKEIHFSVLDIKRVSYDVNWHSTLHSHSFHELFYCIEGEGTFFTTFGEQKISKNSLILVNPYIEHTEFSTEEVPLEYIVIGFRGPEISLPNHTSDNGLFYFEDQENIFEFFLKEIIDQCSEQSLYTSIIVQYIFNAMIFKIHSITNNSLRSQETLTLSNNVTLAKNYIDNHFSKNITLEMVEERSLSSKFHLTRQFKKELSQTPIQYLNSVRLNHAKELLVSTNLTVIQIAENTGFNSYNYFCEKFKKELKQTPLEYRKEQRILQNQ